MSVRTLHRSGNSLVIALPSTASRVLGVAAGDALRWVATPDGTIELQPLTPPSAGAATRAHAEHDTRALRDQVRRLRRRARHAYEAGYHRGYSQGFAASLGGLLLELRLCADDLRALARTAPRPRHSPHPPSRPRDQRPRRRWPPSIQRRHAPERPAPRPTA